MKQALVREQTVVIDSRPVCCRILPSAPTNRALLKLPVLLLHGLGCSCDAWEPALEEFAKRPIGQPIYAADFPGYGGSRGPSEAMGMTELADWTADLMDSLGIGRAHMAGHSMGCQVALEIAMRHPDRVGGIVLIGPTTGQQRVSYRRYTAGLFLDGLREPLRYNLTLARMYAQMGLRRYFATLNKMLMDEPLSYAGRIEASCLVLRGQHDGIVPDRVARELADALPHGRFMEIGNAAHALQYGDPTAFADAAVPFWQESEAVSPSSVTFAEPGEGA